MYAPRDRIRLLCFEKRSMATHEMPETVSGTAGRSEQWLQTIIDSTPAVVYVVDASG